MREHKRDKGRLEDIKQYALNVESIIEGITFDVSSGATFSNFAPRLK